MSQTDGPEYAPGAGLPTTPPAPSPGDGPKDGSSEKPNAYADESGASLWVRALYMILFGVIAYVVLWLVFFASVLQLIVFLVTAKPNPELRHFNREAARYLGIVVRFLLFLDDAKPFPFSPFPAESEPPAAS